jgi:hypothetical protein
VPPGVLASAAIARAARGGHDGRAMQREPSPAILHPGEAVRSCRVALPGGQLGEPNDQLLGVYPGHVILLRVPDSGLLPPDRPAITETLGFDPGAVTGITPGGEISSRGQTVARISTDRPLAGLQTEAGRA